MSKIVDKVIRGAKVVSGSAITEACVAVDGELIVAVGDELVMPAAREVVDASGLYLLPGAIDSHVHFRDPGYPHKETWRSGSAAAACGGVTTVFEMPNTKPATTTVELLHDKLQRAAGRAHSDFAFFLGASAQNADHLGEWEQTPGCAGVKVFMGSSTGDLLVPDDPTVERVLRSGKRRVAVHAEDDYRLKERYAALKPGTHVRQHG